MNEEERVEMAACPYVLGPISDCDDLSEDGDRLWQAEVQTMGGYGVAATIYAGTEDAARQMAERAIAAWNTRASLQGVSTTANALSGECSTCRGRGEVWRAAPGLPRSPYPERCSDCDGTGHAAAPTAPVQDDDALIDRLCRGDEELLRAVYEKIGEVAREKNPELPAAAFDEAGAEERHSVGLFAAAIVRALEPFRPTRLSADHTGVPRDPTPEMLMAGRKQCAADCLGEHMGPNVERIWQIMHDTARGDQSPDASGGDA